MNSKEFLDQFADVLGLPSGELSPETELGSLESWDSVAYLAVIVLIDEKLGLALRPDVLSRARTAGDILTAVKAKLED